MHIFVEERGIFLPKHAGGRGMGDGACKTSFFWGFGGSKSLLLLSRLTCRPFGMQIQSCRLVLYVIVLIYVRG
jgi:hypothetical protein